ncbi:MAG: FitA-like ribbon-helix-helix domain-containing protein, partial [Micromonosporaceae bacterium]
MPDTLPYRLTGVHDPDRNPAGSRDRSTRRFRASVLSVATLQVKNLDESLHTALRTRAEQEGTTLSELVTRIIRRELARPS